MADTRGGTLNREQVGAIRALDLHKTYSSGRRKVDAVRGLDLDVRRGEFFGILGPNGAGKSTTIGILTTLIRPTSGSATVAGVEVTRDPVAVKRRIGVVAQQNNLDSELSAQQNLEFRGRYFGLPAAESRRRAARLLEVSGLSHRAHAMPHQLSGGEAKRVAIARALMHTPEILILDEPTAAVDPHSRRELWNTVRSFQASGLTVLLTTHHLAEAETLCDRVAIIDKGQLLTCDTVASLVSRTGGGSVLTAYFDGPADQIALAGLPDVTRVDVDGDCVRLFTQRTEGLLNQLMVLGSAAGRAIRDVVTIRPSLESAYLALTGKEYRA
jgi:ABC-2 type transport system ATP-binding protein